MWSLKFILFLMCFFGFFFLDSYLCAMLVRMHNKAFGLIALQALCYLISFGKELHS